MSHSYPFLIDKCLPWAIFYKAYTSTRPLCACDLSPDATPTLRVFLFTIHTPAEGTTLFCHPGLGSWARGGVVWPTSLWPGPVEARAPPAAPLQRSSTLRGVAEGHPSIPSVPPLPPPRWSLPPALGPFSRPRAPPPPGWGPPVRNWTSFPRGEGCREWPAHILPVPPCPEAPRATLLARDPQRVFWRIARYAWVCVCIPNKVYLLCDPQHANVTISPPSLWPNHKRKFPETQNEGMGCQFRLGEGWEGGRGGGGCGVRGKEEREGVGGYKRDVAALPSYHFQSCEKSNKQSKQTAQPPARK